MYVCRGCEDSIDAVLFETRCFLEPVIERGARCRLTRATVAVLPISESKNFHPSAGKPRLREAGEAQWIRPGAMQRLQVTG